MSGPRLVGDECYLVLRAERSGVLQRNGLPTVWDANITSMRKSRPKSLARDEIAVRVRIKIPATAFEPLTPDVTIEIPEDLIVRGPIEVTAEQPASE